jgi:uncharacterized protein (TIGR02147 family)
VTAAPAKILKQAGRDLRVSDYLSYREYLETLYRRATGLVPNYSYEAFAADLGLSKTNALRLAVIGRRNLAVSSARKVAQALALKHDDRRYWLLLVEQNNARSASARDALFQELLRLKASALPSAAFRTRLAYYADWYNPIIREMTGMPDFRSDPHWIARRLYHSVRPRQVQASLDLLSDLGLIVYDRELGRHRKTDDDVIVDRSFDHMAMARYHQKMIEMARDSVTVVPEDERDHNALTVCIPPSVFERLKALSDELVDQALAMERDAATSSEPKQVYQLNTNLFRLTKSTPTRRRRHEPTG